MKYLENRGHLDAILPRKSNPDGEIKRRFKSGSSDQGFRHCEFFYRMCLAVVLMAALALATGSGALAATITVNSTADPGSAGICTLRDAITAANDKAATNGCAAGTGTDTIKFSVTGTITLGATLPAIDGNLTIIGPTTTPGITIDGGRTGTRFSGHRIMEVNAALTLRFLTLANALSHQSGGAIANGGALTVAESTFSHNAAGPMFGSVGGLDAGAIFNTGTLSVSNTTFSSNVAVAACSLGSCSGGSGGAIDNSGVAAVTNSTFSNNKGPAAGGAIANSGSLSVTNSTFANNSSDSTGLHLAGQGGAIFSSGTLNVINSTFSQDLATASPGFTSFSRGGAIYANGTATLITDSTFTGNSAPDGAAVFGPSRIKGSILAASGDGGGNCSTPHPIDAGDNISDDTSCGFSGTGAMGQKL